MTEGIKAWAVLQPSAVASRFEAMHATRLGAQILELEDIAQKTPRVVRDHN
jgi:hypothetical protein